MHRSECGLCMSLSLTDGEFLFLQRMFYSLGLKMSELSDSVQEKRIELQRLLRVKAVKEVVESQVSSLIRQFFFLLIENC